MTERLLESLNTTIKALSDAKVAKITLPDVSIEFFPHVSAWDSWQEADKNNVDPSKPVILQEMNSHGKMELEKSIREDQLANLILEDPVAFDELAQKGELKDKEVDGEPEISYD